MADMGFDTELLDRVDELRKSHPRANEERLWSLFMELIKNNPTLQEVMLRGAFDQTLTELYDEQAKTGREIPPALRWSN